jgi:hypothetical protein
MQLNVTNSSESFIPIQRIINDKVKLTFNEYPEEAELRNLQPKKNVQNISFNYDRTESDLSASTKTHFLNTRLILSQMYLILYKPTDWIIKFGNGLLSLHYFFW